MTITYPRAFPLSATNMQEAWIDLVDNVASSPSGRNQTLINLSRIDDPVWVGRFITPPLDAASQATWSAWRKSLRGVKTFVAFDVRRLTPLAYPSAKVSTDISGGWNGTAAVASVGLSGALGLTGLPPNYALKAGDRIGLEQSGYYGYHEVIEDVTANGGGAVTVTVAPFLYQSLFNTSAVCRVWRPYCQFVLDQSSWSEQGTKEASPISFTGVQRL